MEIVGQGEDNKYEGRIDLRKSELDVPSWLVDAAQDIREQSTEETDQPRLIRLPQSYKTEPVPIPQNPESTRLSFISGDIVGIRRNAAENGAAYFGNIAA